MSRGSGNVTNGEEEPGRMGASGDSLLVAEHLKLGYEVDGELQVAVEDASFAVRPGERVMLIGPSGCGKSTLLKTVAGIDKTPGSWEDLVFDNIKNTKGS